MGYSNEQGSFLIRGCDVVLPDRVIKGGAVLAAEGSILVAGPADRVPSRLPKGCRTITAEGALACPSLWESHLHGYGGVSTENMTPDSLVRMAKFLSRRGVGVFLPTTVSQNSFLTNLGEALESTATHHDVRGRVAGIHVEGPFVAVSRRGGIPERLIRPASTRYLDELLTHARGRIRIMTYAPELDGAAALAAHMQKTGILPSLGHSDARYNSLQWCEHLSPLSVTHLFNAMSGLSHKEPGLAQWALLDRNVFTELICDGVHVHDAAVQLALRTRPWEKLVLVSDAIAPAGLGEDGVADTGNDAQLALYGKRIVARGAGFFYADSGVLVGSRFLVADGIARLVGEFRMPIYSAVAMATLNPARLLGFARKGALLPGYDADVALLSRDFTRCAFLSWEGRILFERARASREAA